MQYYKKKYTWGYKNKWKEYLKNNIHTNIYSPTEGLWRWWSHLHTLGRSSPHLKMTEWRWLPIFWCRVVNGCGYPVFWGGRGQTSDLWNTLQDGRSGRPIVWIRYLGDDPQDQANPFQIPPQGSLLIRGNSSGARHVKAVGVPIFGGSYRDSGPRGNGDIIPPPT